MTTTTDNTTPVAPPWDTPPLPETGLDNAVQLLNEAANTLETANRALDSLLEETRKGLRPHPAPTLVQQQIEDAVKNQPNTRAAKFTTTSMTEQDRRESSLRITMGALAENDPTNFATFERWMGPHSYDLSDPRHPEDCCWVWMGAIDGTGEPVVEDDANNWYYVRRLAWFAYLNTTTMPAALPPHTAVEATCGESYCINPTHLGLRPFRQDEYSWPLSFAQRVAYERRKDAANATDPTDDRTPEERAEIAEWLENRTPEQRRIDQRHIEANNARVKEYEEWTPQTPHDQTPILLGPGTTMTTPISAINSPTSAPTGSSSGTPTTNSGKPIVPANAMNVGPTPTAPNKPSNAAFTYGVTPPSGQVGIYNAGGIVGLNPRLVGAAEWDTLRVRGDLRSLSASPNSPNAAHGTPTAPRTAPSRHGGSMNDGANFSDNENDGDEGDYYDPRDLEGWENVHHLWDRTTTYNSDFRYTPHDPKRGLKIGQTMLLGDVEYIMMPGNWMRKLSEVTPTYREILQVQGEQQDGVTTPKTPTPKPSALHNNPN